MVWDGAGFHRARALKILDIISIVETCVSRSSAEELGRWAAGYGVSFWVASLCFASLTHSGQFGLRWS